MVSSSFSTTSIFLFDYHFSTMRKLTGWWRHWGEQTLTTLRSKCSHNVCNQPMASLEQISNDYRRWIPSMSESDLNIIIIIYIIFHAKIRSLKTTIVCLLFCCCEYAISKMEFFEPTWIGASFLSFISFIYTKLPFQSNKNWYGVMRNTNIFYSSRLITRSNTFCPGNHKYPRIGINT